MLRAWLHNSSMDARSDARFLTFGQDPSSPEGKWLAATELKEKSPAQQPSQNNLPAMTPTSAARTLFSPSLPPVAGSSPNSRALAQPPTLLAVLNKRDEIAAAAAAAAQELHVLEAAAIAAGIDITPSQGPAVAAAGAPVTAVAAAATPAPAVAAAVPAPAIAAAGLPPQSPTAATAMTNHAADVTGPVAVGAARRGYYVILHRGSACLQT